MNESNAMRIFHRAQWVGLLVKITSALTNFMLITDKSAFHLTIRRNLSLKIFVLSNLT